MGRVPYWLREGYTPPEPEPEDDGLDTVGDNPTGRPRKSSARTRRKKARRLFGGTKWDKES